MKRHASFVLTIVLSIICLLLNTGCGDAADHPVVKNQSATTPPSAASTDGLLRSQNGQQAGQTQARAGGAEATGSIATFALANADPIQKASADNPNTTTPLPEERRIIRNAEFTFIANNPGDAQRRITSIAEAHGGFVVKSEINKSSGDSENDASYTSVTVIVRVPSSHFGAAIDEIRGTGNRIIQESITGQDVTEEYIDLEARIKTKKALEAQFLDILKQARTVHDAMDVQTEIADVRTEIERLEGRRRFLENQSALSTITVTLKPTAPMVAANPTGFFYSLKQTVSDAADLSVTIVLAVIRAIILLIPVAVLVFLPCYLVTKFLIVRLKSARKVEAMAAD